MMHVMSKTKPTIKAKFTFGQQMPAEVEYSRSWKNSCAKKSQKSKRETKHFSPKRLLTFYENSWEGMAMRVKIFHFCCCLLAIEGDLNDNWNIWLSEEKEQRVWWVQTKLVTNKDGAL